MAEFNLDNIATDLNNKIGKNECVRYPVSKWQSSDGLSWYIVYNDGWKECGGQITGGASSFTTLTFPLPSGFSDTNYSIIGQVMMSSTSTSLFQVKFNTGAKTNTSISFATIFATSSSVGHSSYPAIYYACGY